MALLTSPYGISTGRGGSSDGRSGQAWNPTFSSAAYGSVPNPTPMPESTWQEAMAADPNLAGLNTSSDSVIQGQLAGQLSPQTTNAIRDSAASFGVASGMPGSQFQGFNGLRQLGLSVEGMQQQGLGNYLNALKSTGSMQLDPSLVTGISQYNNALAAAPDPAAAAEQNFNLEEWMRQQNRGPAGGTGQMGGGYTINPGPASPAKKPQSNYGGVPNYDMTGGGTTYYNGSVPDTTNFNNTGTYSFTGNTYGGGGYGGDYGGGSTYIQQPGSEYDPTLDPSSSQYDPYAMPPSDTYGGSSGDTGA